MALGGGRGPIAPLKRAAMRSLDDILEEYEFLEGDERYSLLIELGRELEPMPDALKTDATLVRGCSAAVWVRAAGCAAGRLAERHRRRGEDGRSQCICTMFIL